MEEKKPIECVRVASYSPTNGEIGLRGLADGEIEKIQSMVNGNAWLKVVEGRIETCPTRQPLPSPAEDTEMIPFWRHPLPEEKPVQMKLFKSPYGSELDWPPFSPSIIISHLCGYYYTPEKYIQQAKQLESFGFECLRSRRGEDGKYWETWLLPSFWMAKGDLKEHLDAIKDEKEKLDKAVSFLCRHASFGTLDVMVQRAAMTIDD